MEILGTNGKKYNIDVKQDQAVLKTESACKSKLQYDCGQYLKNKYPFDIILEDFYISCEGFYLDFFLPRRKLIIEVDGKQHSEYVPYFHKSKKNFIQAQNRDKKKNYWCDLNGFTIIRINSVEELE